MKSSESASFWPQAKALIGSHYHLSPPSPSQGRAESRVCRQSTGGLCRIKATKTTTRCVRCVCVSCETGGGKFFWATQQSHEIGSVGWPKLVLMLDSCSKSRPAACWAWLNAHFHAATIWQPCLSPSLSLSLLLRSIDKLVCSSACLSICLPFWPAARLSVCSSINRSVRVYVCVCEVFFCLLCFFHAKLLTRLTENSFVPQRRRVLLFLAA